MLDPLLRYGSYRPKPPHLEGLRLPLRKSEGASERKHGSGSRAAAQTTNSSARLSGFAPAKLGAQGELFAKPGEHLTGAVDRNEQPSLIADHSVKQPCLAPGEAIELHFPSSSHAERGWRRYRFSTGVKAMGGALVRVDASGTATAAASASAPPLHVGGGLRGRRLGLLMNVSPCTRNI